MATHEAFLGIQTRPKTPKIEKKVSLPQVTEGDTPFQDMRDQGTLEIQETKQEDEKRQQRYTSEGTE